MLLLPAALAWILLHRICPTHKIFFHGDRLYYGTIELPELSSNLFI